MQYGWRLWKSGGCQTVQYTADDGGRVGLTKKRSKSRQLSVLTISVNHWNFCALTPCDLHERSSVSAHSVQPVESAITLLSNDVKITSHFYWISKLFRNYPKLPKYWAIRSFRGNKYKCPMSDELLRHLKCAFLYIYDDAIFDGYSHWSKLDSIWLGSNAPIFDITSFSFMHHSKPDYYLDGAW